MSYRGPDARRIAGQEADIFRRAGYTATWRQFVSATSGVPAAGLGGSSYYREQTITALFGAGRQPERQVPGGMIAAAELLVTTRERLGRRDELVWRGETYRVDGDPVPAPVTNQWISPVKRST